MKNIFILLVLSLSLFSDELCDMAKTKIDRALSIMIIDAENKDYVSLNKNHLVYNYWVNIGIMNCSDTMSEFYIKQKKTIEDGVKGTR